VVQETLHDNLDRLERELIIEALENARGNMSKAAKALGITERVMGLRVGKHNLDPKTHRGGP